MIQNIISRAEVLMSQKKYAEADKLLMGILPANPDDSRLLSMLAEINLQLDRNEKAENLINTAIGKDPEDSYLFYIKARISLNKNDFDSTEKNIQYALALDPGEAVYYALLASVKLAKKQYQQALELADQSLELDPENIAGLNIRSTALLKLNKKEASFATIEGALREDPNNTHTHTNYGWGLLEKGDSKKALEHFREALKSDPNNEMARAGMVEALKANNVIYKLFLKYSFWIGNLTAKYQWGVIIGFYLGVNLLKSIARSNESLQPYLFPLIGLLALIAFSTWVITPISNLFLRLNKYGRHLLDKKEIWSANFTGISFVVFLIGLLAYFVAGDERFILLAGFGFAMMVPFSSMFAPAKYKYSLVVYAAVMALVGTGGIVLSFTTGEMFNILTGIFIFGFIAFQWAANYLLIRQNNV